MYTSIEDDCCHVEVILKIDVILYSAIAAVKVLQMDGL